jgi:hypothetical protein
MEFNVAKSGDSVCIRRRIVLNQRLALPETIATYEES